MDLEEKTGFDKDLSSSGRASVSSGTFSIESILKTGGFRCVQTPQQDFSSLPGLRHTGLGLMENVKKEELEENCVETIRRLPGPGLLSPGPASLSADTAACHDDSGRSLDWSVWSQVRMISSCSSLQRTRTGWVMTGRSGPGLPSQRHRSRLWSVSLRKINICPSPRGCSSPNNSS